MSDLWTGVLIGAVIAIPIGIGVNLATPKLQKRLDKRSQRAADKAALRDAELLELATGYADDYASFQTYLFDKVLFGIFAITSMLLCTGIAALLFFVTPSLTTYTTPPPGETIVAIGKLLNGTLSVLTVVVIAIAYVLGLLVINRLGRAAVVVRMVRDVKSKRSEAEAPGIVTEGATEATP